MWRKQSPCHVVSELSIPFGIYYDCVYIDLEIQTALMSETSKQWGEQKGAR